MRNEMMRNEGEKRNNEVSRENHRERNDDEESREK